MIISSIIYVAAMMPFWQLQTPLSAVLFDCDGTLSTIEGIDTLADINGHAAAVKDMTASAMGETGLTPALYQSRLELVRPTRQQVHELGQMYYDHRVPDVDAVINTLQRLNKSIYIVSAGLYPAVAIFADLLSIPRTNIFAVPITFDVEGRYQDFDHTSPLIRSLGKREIVSQIMLQHARALYTGDGVNDLDVYDQVTRFVGYGGTFYRATIEERCEFYIKTLSFSPLLPLALTNEETTLLAPAEKTLYERGLSGVSLKPEFKRP